MPGFFDLPTAPPAQKVVRGATGCEACGLYRQVNSPRIPATGEGRLKTLIIGEAPGGTEDKLNSQFVGEAGSMLRKHLRIAGFDLDRDFWKTNSLSCRPTNDKGNNRPPTDKEIKCCEPIWRTAVGNLKPDHILLFGEKAVKAFLMYRSQPIAHKTSIGRWRKICFPDSITGAWVTSLYHPSFVVRNPDAEGIFKLDLLWALDQLKRTPPEFPDYQEKVTKLTNFDELVSFLRMIIEHKPTMTLDYETSGLKPYHPGHHIWSMSVALYQDDRGFAWPYSYPGHWTSEQLEIITDLWCQILSDPEIYKTGQNIQMEHPWSKQILKTEIKGWIWDTMVRSHVNDERHDYTSLDFQTFINWGYEYGSSITKYKKFIPGTHFNTIHKAPLNELLDYGGLDGYFQMRLAEKQWEESNFDTKEAKAANRAYDLYHKGILCFADMEEAGIPVRTDYYRQTHNMLEKRETFLLKRLNNSAEAKLFRVKAGRDMDFGSADDINKLLYTYLQMDPVKYTAKAGKPSTSADVLESLDLPFVKDIIKLRKIEKNKTTYIEGILRSEVEGKIHTSFNLHLVSTYRSSSSDPNFHNLPKRDKIAMAMIRGGIIPSPGNQIGEADYGAMEVRIIGCYSKDPALIKPAIELRDKFDPHQMWADVLGTSRFDAKNAFVFALFYGSYWKSIWKNLVNRGYENLSMLKVQKAEADFWKLYKVTKKWQERHIEEYKSTGFIEMFHGFRRRGWLERNKLVNTPIQGTAFHCLLWSAIRVNEIRKAEGWKTKLIGQIHDSLILDMVPSEVPHVMETVRRVMTEDIVKEHPWIITPLLSEIEVSEVDQPWHLKKEYDDYEEVA